MSRLGGRLRALRERPLEQRHFRATVVLVVGLGLAAAGFAALGPSLGAFTATVSSQAEVGAGSLDLSVVAPTPASSPTSCTANAGNSFSATCAGADVTTTAAPGQFNAADWQAVSSGTITPGNDAGFTFSLTPSSCSGSNTTVCGDTEVTVDELAAEPNVATPLPGYSYQTNTTSYYLFGVSCPSTTVCVAVGDTSGSSASDGVILTSVDGGATWSSPTDVAGPLAGTTNTELYFVSCPSTASCVVLGNEESSSGTYTGLAVEGSYSSSSSSWTWTPTTVSSVRYFLGVSCLSTTTDCVAVGDASTSPYSFVATTTTDGGGTWSSPTTLNTASANAFVVNELACTGSTTSGTCVALWNADPPSSTSTAEAYVGTWSSGSLTWDTTGTAFPTAGDLLNSVACPTSTSCVAVGQNNAGASPTAGVADTLSIASGAGTWGTPTSPSGTAALDGVACTSASDCVAMGSWNPSGSYYYDASTTTADGGTTWSTADQFSDAGAASYGDFGGLLGVSCASSTSTECSAVGNYGSATSANSGQSWAGYQPLACVYGTAGTGTPASNVSQTCDFSSSDTLATLGAAGLQTLQPSTVAGSGVLIEVATQLASTASTSDEGASATVPLSFEVSS